MAKIALGTWAWGAGAFGGDAVFGSKTDVNNLKPVFDAAMKAGLNLWDTATVYGMGESEKILGTFVAGVEREAVEVSTKFTPQLAEGTKYFAIRHTAQDIFGLMLDDVTYERGASAPVGYNIYVDGELVGSTPDTAYDLPAAGLADGQHTFAVTAVYEGGRESAPATAVIDITSGINEVTMDGQPVDVYTIDGRLVRRQATSLEGLKGIYLIGNKKVYVK